MSISVVQTAAPIYNSNASSIANNAFSSNPVSGNLQVFVVWVANTATITPPAGFTELYTFQSTIRRVGVYAKISGASEPTQQTFTISPSAATWVFAQEWAATLGWQSVTAGATPVGVYDSTGSVNSINASISSSAGSLILAAAYTSNSTADNKAITSGYGSLIYSAQGGTSLRAALTSKIGAGSDTATLSIVDATNDARISLVLIEFKEQTAGSPVINTVGSDNSATIGAATAVTVSGFSSAVNAGICDGVALTAASNTSITLPGFVDEQQCPMAGNAADGTARVLSLTNGSQTANKSIDVNTPEIGDNPGIYWAATTLVDPLDMTDASVVKDFAVAGDIMYNDPTKGIMYADGTFDAFESEQTFWHHEASTHIVRSVAFAVYSVAPEDFAVTVDFTGPSLTTGITVSADDLISISNFDPAPLSYVALISPADLSVQTEFSSPTLLLGYSIQPDDFALAISYTAPDLTLGYAVQPGDLVSTPLFSSPSLLLGFAVQPADLSASIALTQPALVTDYSVQPLNLSALSIFTSPYINNSTGPIKAGVLVIVKPQTLIIEVLQ